MKPSSLIALSALAVSCAAFAGGAHPAADAASAEVKMMDTNKDGYVSPAEHATGAKKMFGQMDADHDGKVTAAEMDVAHKKMQGEMKGHQESAPENTGREMSSADKIKVVDANNDGTLTAQEHKDASESMFKKMDADKDGNLTLAEVQAGHEQMMGSSRR
jgi:Ca2+-binding EF-hand superfamily protein